LNNAQRIETYLIESPRGSREIAVNGAAARLFYKGDRVIIAGFAYLSETELAGFKPKVVVLDQTNHIISQP
jgi:aspartate 1-decarboxylase